MKLCCFYFTTRWHGKLLEWWSTTPGCTIYCTEKLKQRLNLVVQGHINVLMTNLVISVSASQYKSGSKVHRAISSCNIPRTFETIYLTRLRSSVPPLTVQVSSFPACLSLLQFIYLPVLFHHNLFSGFNHSYDFVIKYFIIFMSLSIHLNSNLSYIFL